jgi:hypothetical protein
MLAHWVVYLSYRYLIADVISLVHRILKVLLLVCRTYFIVCVIQRRRQLLKLNSVGGL